jgi:serine/threonine protein kinase
LAAIPSVPIDAMSSNHKCGKCGTELPGAELLGLCPSCVARQAFALEEDSLPPIPEWMPEANRRFGDYELMEEIARGGMGVVYKARQISLNRIVAVKMILTGRLASLVDVQRFRAEAESAANLQHPNIVAIHEVGQRNGQDFFSMDYVPGPNLAEWSAACRSADATSGKTTSPTDGRRWADCMRTVARAIQYAHEQGIVHRDLKPSNILMDAHDRPRITDFGLAKRVSESPDLTLTGQVIGSPQFMPPEQASGRRGATGPQSDVYSLGAILYFLLTGRPPFEGETAHATIEKLLDAEPHSPSGLQPGVPRDLEVICLKCLQKEPNRRYASAKALADDLDHFLNHEPIEARPEGNTEKLWRMARRHRTIVTLLAALVLVPVLVGVLLIRHFDQIANLAPERTQLAPIAPLPTISAQGVAGVINGKIYVTSPATGESHVYSRLFHGYDPKLNSWTNLADTLTNQTDAGGGVIAGRLYVVGGDNGPSGPCNFLEEYNPASNSWRFKAPMHTARNHPAVAVLNNKLYVIGGHDGAKPLATVESYDATTDRWTPEPDLLGPRNSCGVCALNGILYVAGGGTNLQGDCSGTMEMLRPGAKWELLQMDNSQSMPTPVRNAFCAELNGTFYFLGGNSEGSAVDRSQCIWLMSTNRFWQFQTPMPEVRYAGSGAVVWNGKIWLFGGWTSLPNPAIPHRDVFVFDPLHNSWSRSSSGPATPRSNQ